MTMDDVRGRLVTLAARAAKRCSPRSYKQILAALSAVEACRTCAEALEAIRQIRASEGWAGRLEDWAWFDDKLFALSDELDCEETGPARTIVDLITMADRTRERTLLRDAS